MNTALNIQHPASDLPESQYAPMTMKQLALITNLASKLYFRQTTSRTSLRSFFIKEIILENFFQHNIPCHNQWVIDQAGEDPNFVNRNINRSIKANRYRLIDDQLYPTQPLIKDLKSIYRDSQIPFTEPNNRYGIKITPFRILEFLTAYCAISMVGKNQATLLQQAIELALWEAYFLFKKKNLITSQIAQRLQVSKSTLSTALATLIEQQLLAARSDSCDNRIIHWHLNPKDSSIREKYGTIKRFFVK